MEDIKTLALPFVYLTGSKPYSVKGEGANAGKTYSGNTYSFLMAGQAFKISSDSVDLTHVLDEKTQEPVGGVLSVGFRVKGGYLAPILVSFKKA